jgi:putative transposase
MDCIFRKWAVKNPNLYRVLGVSQQDLLIAYIERFNRSYKEDILDAYLFESIDQLRELSTNWMNDYNQFHHHQSLNNMSPLKYLESNQHI